MSPVSELPPCQTGMADQELLLVAKSLANFLFLSFLLMKVLTSGARPIGRGEARSPRNPLPE